MLSVATNGFLGLSRKAQAWQDKASEESKVGPRLSENFVHSSLTQASLDEAKGHMRASNSWLREGIEYLTHSYGEENPQIGRAKCSWAKHISRTGMSAIH